MRYVGDGTSDLPEIGEKLKKKPRHVVTHADVKCSFLLSRAQKYNTCITIDNYYILKRDPKSLHRRVFNSYIEYRKRKRLHGWVGSFVEFKYIQ